MRNEYKFAVIMVILLSVLINAQILTNGLVAHYPFTGNAYDFSGYGNHGTVTGAALTTDRFGNSNSAYYFNGSTDSIKVSNSSSLNVEKLTIASWVYYEGASYNGHIVSKGLGQYDLFVETTMNSIIGGSVNGTTIRSGTSLALNKWTFLCLVKDNDSVYLFMDGQQIKSEALPGNITASFNNLLIGRHPQDANSCFKGKIDDIRIYNYALSKEIISLLYHENGWDNNGLVAYYPFTGNAYDMSGNAHHGSVINATLTQDKLNMPNSAYYFNGTNSYIKVNHSDVFNYTGSNDLSISCWIKPEEFNGGGIWCKANPGGISNYCMLINPNGKLSIHEGHFSSGASGFESNQVLSANQWYHVVVVFQGNTATLYINNTQDANYTFNGSISVNTADLYFGDDTDGLHEYFKGAIDEIRFYNRSLSVSEISVLYNFITSVFGNNKDNSIANYGLFQNYPNPFNPSTIISYQLPKYSDVTLKVYDILGKEVATLVNETQNAGTYNITFDASKLSSGVYLYQLKAGDFVSSKKLLLMK